MINFSGLTEHTTALYCDVDGTLVSADNQVTPVVKREIEQFVDAGFQFTLATGRNFRGVQRICSILPITAPLVLCNGAYVYDPVKQTDSFVSIPAQVAQALLPLLLDLDNVTVYVDTADRTFWVSHESAQSEQYSVVEQLNPRLFHTASEVITSNDIVKVGVKLLHQSKATHQQLQQVFTRIEEELEGQLHYCFSNVNYVEFMTSGVSKWTGIQTSQNMKMKQEDVLIAVGDEHNDIEMVANAHIGVAMGNAVDAVKKRARHCIGNVGDDGLAYFLRYIRTRDRAASG